MKEHTTFRVGGPADLFIMPKDAEELKDAIEILRKYDTPVMVIGNGSNLLVKDGGIRGLVIRLCRDMQHIEVHGNRIRAQAGAMMSTLSMAAAEANLAGLTFASGIPGTVGGGVYMNAGAYGSQISAVLTASEYLRDGVIHRREAADHAFGYRTSVYRSTDDVILSAEFTLTPGDPEAIAAKAKQNMESRRSKQPLEYPNAGSVFKRPEGAFPGALIEQAGLKGLRIGGAEISEKHANFIINCGNATADDILRLTETAQKRVYSQFGILLETEIIHIQ